MEDCCISIADKVAESLVEPIRRQICYAFNYQDNVRKLKEEVDLLTDAEDSVNRRVEEARTRRGEEIEPQVDKWRKRVHTAKEEAGKVVQDEERAKQKCFMGLCPNFRTRYQLSRSAEEHAKVCAKLREEGNFVTVSYYVPPEHVISVKDYEAFESRMKILDKIMEALMDPHVNLIGVYGMSGVGKTTLVSKVAAHAKEERLFDKVVRAEVKQNPNLWKIQGHIADQLDFTIGNAETVSGRGDRLRQQIKKVEKILVVLDDIWERIDLELLGIPYGRNHKGCKILITSRSQTVLSNDMDTKSYFRLEVLPFNEAWNLFEKMAGDAVKDGNVQPVAFQIAERCGGLPVLLVAIAKALKGRSSDAWEDTLEELKRDDNAEMDNKVFSALKLSYNLLRGDEIKSLFLLCGILNPNGIFVQDLFKYTLGLGLFKRNNASEVRSRLHTLLDDLKASCLLLDGDDHEVVKMHDVVRSFALSYGHHHGFTAFNHEVLMEWPEQIVFGKCTAISLRYCTMPQLPDVLECPKLEFLYLSSLDASLKIPDNFFKRTKELKVLDLTSLHLPSLPSSLSLLENLITLCLEHCVLENVAVTGNMKKLQVLSFSGSNIVSMPQEIGKLTGLCLLDLSKCNGLQLIPRNILACLTQLENLYMKNSFVQWEVEASNNQGNNAKLAELKLLPKLSTLDIHITDAKMLPKDLFLKKLERFKILIGDGWNWFGEHETSRTRKLKLNTSIKLEDGIKALLEKTEDLYLDDLKGFRNILYNLDAQGFPQLKHLHVQNSVEINYIINSIMMGPRVAFPKLESLCLLNLCNLEKICHGQAKCFSNLRKLEVGNCCKMRSLLPSSIAKGLLQLEKINVRD